MLYPGMLNRNMIVLEGSLKKLSMSISIQAPIFMNIAVLMPFMKKQHTNIQSVTADKPGRLKALSKRFARVKILR